MALMKNAFFEFESTRSSIYALMDVNLVNGEPEMIVAALGVKPCGKGSPEEVRLLVGRWNGPLEVNGAAPFLDVTLGIPPPFTGAAPSIGSKRASENTDTGTTAKKPKTEGLPPLRPQRTGGDQKTYLVRDPNNK